MLVFHRCSGIVSASVFGSIVFINESNAGFHELASELDVEVMLFTISFGFCLFSGSFMGCAGNGEIGVLLGVFSGLFTFFNLNNC